MKTYLIIYHSGMEAQRCSSHILILPGSYSWRTNFTSLQ